MSKASSKGKSKAKPGLTKAQLITEVASRSGLTKAQVNDVFEATGGIVAEEIRAGRPVALLGLVKLSVQHRAARPSRPGRNPATGEAMTIKAQPAKKVPKARALKGLKDLV